MTERTPNPDLEVGAGNKQRWNQPAYRRHGFHNAHTLFRQLLAMRSAAVWTLQHRPDAKLAAHPRIADLTGLSTFSALAIARDNGLLFEAYAPDFGASQPHSIQSITKMHVNLVMGRLISQGQVDPGKVVSQYLPSIGSGYASATVQMLLDMGVSNAFSEDYGDPDCDAYLYEVSLGWRLPAAGQPDLPLRHYLATISGDARPSREVDYKSANTDVLAWIAEEVTGGGLVGMLRAITDEAGYQGTFHISTDREGFPALSGGGCLSARDLARFGLLFVRESQAPHGAGGFIHHSLARAAPSFAKPRDWVRYSNHLFTNGRWIGHGGYGGQFLLVDMETGTSCAFLSVLENESGYDQDYMNQVIKALQEIACT